MKIAARHGTSGRQAVHVQTDTKHPANHKTLRSTRLPSLRPQSGVVTDEEPCRAVRLLIKKGAEESDFALSQMYNVKRPRNDFSPLVGFDLNMYAHKGYLLSMGNPVLFENERRKQRSQPRCYRVRRKKKPERRERETSLFLSAPLQYLISSSVRCR